MASASAASVWALNLSNSDPDEESAMVTCEKYALLLLFNVHIKDLPAASTKQGSGVSKALKLPDSLWGRICLNKLKMLDICATGFSTSSMVSPCANLGEVMDVTVVLVDRSNSDMKLETAFFANPDKKQKGVLKTVPLSSASLVSCESFLPSSLRRLSAKKIPLSTLLAELQWPASVIRQLKRLTPNS